jgi:cation/acetate symporter
MGGDIRQPQGVGIDRTRCLVPALFSIAIAFAGIWLFSVLDRSARARAERGGFDAQYVRCQTGIGAAGATTH